MLYLPISETRFVFKNYIHSYFKKSIYVFILSFYLPIRLGRSIPQQAVVSGQVLPRVGIVVSPPLATHVSGSAQYPVVAAPS